MANNREKLQKLLGAFTPPDSEIEGAFKNAQKGVQDVVTKIKKEADSKANGRISEVLTQVQTLFSHLDSLKEDLKTGEGNLVGALGQNLDALRNKMDEYRTSGSEQSSSIMGEIDSIKSTIRDLSNWKKELPDYATQITNLEDGLKSLITDSENKLEGTNDAKIKGIVTASKEAITEIESKIQKLRTDAMSAISSMGGGNMNRNMLVSGNPSTLGRYTDVNFKPGANVTISYQNNDNLKTTDITIASSGGGGGGTSRNISTVSVSSVVAATPSTDIVVIAGAGIQLTLPTAVGNTNLYTIKNKSVSSVLLTPNGAEKIDDQANLILATQYVSIDLISDNANWQIT